MQTLILIISYRDCWNVCLHFVFVFPSVISLHIVVRGPQPKQNVDMTEAEAHELCILSRQIFLSQPILLELEAPLKVCGKLNLNCD